MDFYLVQRTRGNHLVYLTGYSNTGMANWSGDIDNAYVFVNPTATTLNQLANTPNITIIKYSCDKGEEFLKIDPTTVQKAFKTKGTGYDRVGETLMGKVDRILAGYFDNIDIQDFVVNSRFCEIKDPAYAIDGYISQLCVSAYPDPESDVGREMYIFCFVVRYLPRKETIAEYQRTHTAAEFANWEAEISADYPTPRVLECKGPVQSYTSPAARAANEMHLN